MKFLAAVSLTAMMLTQAPADDYGTLKGQIILRDVPPAPVINVTTDKAHCESKGPLLSNKMVVDAKTKGVKNVIVWLRPDSNDRKDRFPEDKIKPSLKNAPAKTHVVDQPCCEFIPRILAVRAGDTIEFRNGAPVAHNIHYTGTQEFNTTLPPGNKKVTVTGPIEASNGINAFKCDIHPWMAGAMRVFDNPYFAITDDKGNFEIKDAPAGNWRLVVWHENGFHNGRNGILGMPVTVGGSETVVPAITLALP